MKWAIVYCFLLFAPSEPEGFKLKVIADAPENYYKDHYDCLIAKDAAKDIQEDLEKFYEQDVVIRCLRIER